MNISKLLVKHSERALKTVGESIVNKTIRNVRSDRRIQDLGISTQEIAHSLSS